MTALSPTSDLVYCRECGTPLAKRSKLGVDQGVYPLVNVTMYYERRKVVLTCPNTSCRHVNRLTVLRRLR